MSFVNNNDFTSGWHGTGWTKLNHVMTLRHTPAPSCICNLEKLMEPGDEADQRRYKIINIPPNNLHTNARWSKLIKNNLKSSLKFFYSICWISKNSICRARIKGAFRENRPLSVPLCVCRPGPGLFSLPFSRAKILCAKKGRLRTRIIQSHRFHIACWKREDQESAWYSAVRYLMMIDNAKEK